MAQILEKEPEPLHSMPKPVVTILPDSEKPQGMGMELCENELREQLVLTFCSKERNDAAWQGARWTGRIIKVSGHLVVDSGLAGCRMFDVVRVGDSKIIGEIIRLLRGDTASIQVYEETSGLGPGEPVLSTGVPLSVELGPGLIGSIYDGIQRPLDVLFEMAGDYITRGLEAPGLDREKKWHFVPSVSIGEAVSSGDVLGTVRKLR